MARKHVLAQESGKYPQYYDIPNPPLIIKGYDLQGVSSAGPTFEDRKNYEMEVNRGAVTGLDYVAYTNEDLTVPGDETNWNAATATITAGGQELIRKDLLQHYTYNVDIGTEEEQYIKTRVGGGQVVQSLIEIQSGASGNNNTVTSIGAQMLAYYSTLKNDRFKESFEWPAGLGLKSRSYAVQHSNAIGASAQIRDVLPKNNGPIVGFSIVYQGLSIWSAIIDLQIDGLKIVDNVSALRFSRYTQRIPQRWLIQLNPGSTFQLDLRTILNTNFGNVTLTFYFAN